MNDFQVKQHLDLIWTWTPNKASITARKNKKEMRSKQISYVVSSRWINVCVWTAPNCHFVSPHLCMNGVFFISLIWYHFLHFVQQCDVQMRIWKYNADLNTFGLSDLGLKRLDGNYSKYTFLLAFTAHCSIPGAH